MSTGSPPRGDHAPSGLDPALVLKGLGSLRRLVGTYPAGHPLITQGLAELYDTVRRHLDRSAPLCVDIVRGEVHLDGVAGTLDGQAGSHAVDDLTSLGVHSVHIEEGVDDRELLEVARFLWSRREWASGESVRAQLEARGVHHVSLGQLVPLDTRWRAQQWPDAPSGPLDPAYAEALGLAKQAFDEVASGRSVRAAAVRDLVSLLIVEVARSHAALAQILTVKQYENLTYCHSVNVAMLSLLIGREIGLDDDTLAAVVEAGLLHDIGKTRVPLDLVKKPGALDAHERRQMEAHTTYGAEILAEADGLGPLTALVALEHHRTVRGFGYPDLGEGVVPHPMSQVVSVADTYEAMTGARSYRAPVPPERACLTLARLAGDRLNTALVKTFVNAITFFPIGSAVRTSQGHIGVVVRTTAGDPLHPVLALTDAEWSHLGDELDTSLRDGGGAYLDHVAETVTPPTDGFDVRSFLARA